MSYDLGCIENDISSIVKGFFTLRDHGMLKGFLLMYDTRFKKLDDIFSLD